MPSTDREARTGLEEPPGGEEEAEEEGALADPPGAEEPASAPPQMVAGSVAAPAPAATEAPAAAARVPRVAGLLIGLAAGAVSLLAFYAVLSFTRLEIFKMLAVELLSPC